MCSQKASLALLTNTVFDVAIIMSQHSSYHDIFIIYLSDGKYGACVMMKEVLLVLQTLKRKLANIRLRSTI